MKNQVLLYGAYGYTGKLITKEAKRRGLQAILAGRNEAKLRAWAQEQELPYRVIDLADTATLWSVLEECAVVVHAAGPYSKTYRPMVEACLATQTHYVDITGEVEVFEAIAQLDTQAKDAGITLLPGAGFDVVPTDCLAKFLHEQLPNAQVLQLAFRGSGGPSRGTARTMAQNLGAASKVRQNGVIRDVPLGHKTLTVPFRSKPSFVMTIPWGDVSTAYYTTGIPNIETYMGVHPKSYRYIRWQKYFGWLLRMSWVRRLAERQVDRGPAGPSERALQEGSSQVWGRVVAADGQVIEGRLEVPNGYALTARTSIEIVSRLLEGQIKAGFWTPANAFGADFILDFEAKREILEEKTWKST